MAATRTQWGSRLGFILAAAGSAVGLGNLWKFPYVTGANGGGLFVLIYLVAVLLVGLPIMMAEVSLGRHTQTSPVGAFRAMSKPGSPWMTFGWLGVATGFIILSYYSVVAGWALDYVWLSITGSFSQGSDPEVIKGIFGELYTNTTKNVVWHLIFMGATVGIVIAGVQQGVERAARILMPALFIMMIVLAVYSITLDGFGKAMEFVFAPHAGDITAGGVLEALGQAFFSLSLGMGAMLTYGSYLSKEDDVVGSSAMIAGLDTGVGLLACLVLFPITFTFNMEPAAGPGLVFTNIPLAFAQMPGGTIWAIIFFVLVVFAALSSAISLLEVAAAYFIDEKGWSRKKAVGATGGAILLLGIPSALSGGDGFFGAGMAEMVGKNWFDSFDYLASNIFLPLGGLGTALFVAWRVDANERYAAFADGSKLSNLQTLFKGYLTLLRYVVPIAIVGVFIHAIGWI